MQTNKANTVVLGVRVSEQMILIIKKILEKGLYVNESDFAREALREKLERIGENRGDSLT